MMKGAVPTKIGFIGLGAMGYPMALNVRSKMPSDGELFVFDVVDKAVERFLAEDGKPGNSAKVIRCSNGREVAEKSDVILSMVPESSHVKDVYIADDTGILTLPKESLENKLLLDCSTIDTATSLTVKDAFASAHPSTLFADAPVSGGVLGAEAGTLTFMVGCSDEAAFFPRVHAILSLMGTNIVACGGPTLGLTAKLCNNYCSGLIAIATSEAFNIGIRSGMSPLTLQKVFKSSIAGSTINEKWNPVPGVCPDAPASKDYKPGFRVELMKKDFGLAVDAAKRVGAELALGDAGLDLYKKASEREDTRGKDSRVVYRYLHGIEEWDRQQH